MGSGNCILCGIKSLLMNPILGYVSVEAQCCQQGFVMFKITNPDRIYRN